MILTSSNFIVQKRLALSRHFTHKVVSYHSKSEFRWAIEEKIFVPEFIFTVDRYPLSFILFAQFLSRE